MKNTPSGDHARSYISDPDERHMCFIRHVSLSSLLSSPNAGPRVWVSEGTHRSVLPSSPALASISPSKISKWCLYSKETITSRSKSNNIDRLCVLYIAISYRVKPSKSQKSLAFIKVVRYVIFLSSPSLSTFHNLTLLSPPPVANRPLPWGSKCAE